MKRSVECFSKSSVTTFVRFSEIEPEVANHVVAGKRLPQWEGKFHTPKMEYEPIGESSTPDRSRNGIKHPLLNGKEKQASRNTSINFNLKMYITS